LRFFVFVSRWNSTVAGPVVLILLASAAVGQPNHARPHALRLSQATRLWVVAPHPDDEVLAVGGLIHQAFARGAAVRVVYLTNGEGYPDGVRLESRERKLDASDFRRYGRRRQDEARAALAALGPGIDAAVFLGFPDAGLCELMRTYWSDRTAPFKSPYTRRDRPGKTDAATPATEYSGQDLTRALARDIDAFRPTMIVVPQKEDEHPDHCAAPYFVADALADLHHAIPGFVPVVFNYIVHYKDWPSVKETRQLAPPGGVQGGASGWIRVPLTDADVAAKRAALGQYRTQLDAMRPFLESFIRTNELLTRQDARRSWTLPVKQSPCCPAGMPNSEF
jgi:LmbE family N-acetylglucosaminyl deacetylase